MYGLAHVTEWESYDLSLNGLAKVFYDIFAWPNESAVTVYLHGLSSVGPIFPMPISCATSQNGRYKIYCR